MFLPHFLLPLLKNKKKIVIKKNKFVKISHITNTNHNKNITHCYTTNKKKTKSLTFL